MPETKPNEYYVEKRELEGDYAVRRRGADHASEILPTQEEAITRAKELNDGAGVDVERVRNSREGSRDQWRGE